MMHLTDEQMMEQAYSESENRAAVERHLASCAACAAKFTALERDLNSVERLVAPARDARYGERVWASIAPALPVYEGPEYASKSRTASHTRVEAFWSGWWAKGLGYAAACALVLSAAFYAGRQWEQRKQQPVAQAQPAKPAPARQPIVVVVLDDHLDRSERFLVQLKHADVDSTELVKPMRDEARSLLAANRVCRKNVAQDNDPELTTALDHLDSLLAQAVNAPGGLNARSIAKLQDEMNADGLLFEVRVLRSRIAHGKSSANTAAKGGTV
jgi:hypothetical protein